MKEKVLFCYPTLRLSRRRGNTNGRKRVHCGDIGLLVAPKLTVSGGLGDERAAKVITE